MTGVDALRLQTCACCSHDRIRDQQYERTILSSRSRAVALPTRLALACQVFFRRCRVLGAVFSNPARAGSQVVQMRSRRRGSTSTATVRRNPVPNICTRISALSGFPSNFKGIETLCLQPDLAGSHAALFCRCRHAARRTRRAGRRGAQVSPAARPLVAGRISRRKGWRPGHAGRSLPRARLSADEA